jgi:hypothetical protein
MEHLGVNSTILAKKGGIKVAYNRSLLEISTYGWPSFNLNYYIKENLT